MDGLVCVRDLGKVYFGVQIILTLVIIVSTIDGLIDCQPKICDL